MARRYDSLEPATVRESFTELTVDDLKPLLKLLTTTIPTCKNDLVEALTAELTDPRKVQALYSGLDEGKQAIQEATHHPEGILELNRFEARYGHPPVFWVASEDKYGWGYSRRDRPLRLALFFPGGHCILPTDLRDILLKFVSPPPPFVLETLANFLLILTGRSTTGKETNGSTRHSSSPSGCVRLPAKLSRTSRRCCD